MRRVFLAIPLVALALVTGCAGQQTGSTSEQVNVPLPAERSADIKLGMRSGDIKLTGAAAGLLEGTLTYDAADTRPTVATGSIETTAGKVAVVKIEQGETKPLVQTARLWDLRVNGGLPTNIDVSNSSGGLDIDLKDADPKFLTIASSSGETKLGLAGPHPSLSQLNVASSSGQVDVKATGEYPALEGFFVDSKSGNVSVDFSGTWRKDFTAQVKAASGDVTLVMPRDVNVTVTAITSSGNVSAEGFTERKRHGGPAPVGKAAGSVIPPSNVWQRRGDKYTGTTLTVFVRVSSGNITLQVAPKK